jgi:hypothetical protein
MLEKCRYSCFTVGVTFLFLLATNFWENSKTTTFFLFCLHWAFSKQRNKRAKKASIKKKIIQRKIYENGIVISQWGKSWYNQTLSILILRWEFIWTISWDKKHQCMVQCNQPASVHLTPSKFGRVLNPHPPPPKKQCGGSATIYVGLRIRPTSTNFSKKYLFLSYWLNFVQQLNSLYSFKKIVGRGTVLPSLALIWNRTIVIGTNPHPPKVLDSCEFGSWSPRLPQTLRKCKYIGS